jgi:hypothetical protein
MANTGSNRIDIQRAGIYDVFGIVAFDLSSDPSARNITQIRKNDAQIAFSEGAAVANTYPTTPSLSRIIWAVGDNVSLAGYQIKGTNASFVGGALSDGAAQLSVSEIPVW